MRMRRVTVSFCTLAFAQLWHVFNMREEPRHPVKNEITRNSWIWAAIGLCTMLILAAVYTPLFAAVLQLSSPGAAGWLVVALFSVVPLLTMLPVRRLSDELGNRQASR